MVRTNIVLDPSILDRAKDLTGIRTTKGVVDYALKELVRHKRQRDLIKLKGKIKWEGDLSRSRLS